MVLIGIFYFVKKKKICYKLDDQLIENLKWLCKCCFIEMNDLFNILFCILDNLYILISKYFV